MNGQIQLPSLSKLYNLNPLSSIIPPLSASHVPDDDENSQKHLQPLQSKHGLAPKSVVPQLNMDDFPRQESAQSANVDFQPWFVLVPPHLFRSAFNSQSKERESSTSKKFKQKLSHLIVVIVTYINAVIFV